MTTSRVVSDRAEQSREASVAPGATHLAMLLAQAHLRPLTRPPFWPSVTPLHFHLASPRPEASSGTTSPAGTPLVSFLVSGLAAPVSSASLLVQPGPRTFSPSPATPAPLPSCLGQTAQCSLKRGRTQAANRHVLDSKNLLAPPHSTLWPDFQYKWFATGFCTDRTCKTHVPRSVSRRCRL